MTEDDNAPRQTETARPPSASPSRRSLRSAPDMPEADRATSLPLWPLALLAALLPAAAALLALWLAVRAGWAPACNPFIDGCVSISRAARHDLPNHLFLRALAPLGLAAAAALVLYVSFLGTEGPIYRGLRQYGTVVYFGFTCLCLLLAGEGMLRLAASRRVLLPRALPAALTVLAALLVALGLVNALVAALFDAKVKARIENVTEWWGALVFVLGFAALALAWRRLGLRVTIAPPLL